MSKMHRILTMPVLLGLCGGVFGIVFVALLIMIVFVAPWGSLLACILGGIAGAVGILRIGRVYQQSILDEGSGLYNRRMLFRRLERAFATAMRHKQPLTFLMIEIDEMRTYNNRYGHVFGDQVIRAVGQSIKDTVGIGGLVGRWGGDEFGVILPTTSALQSQALAITIASRIAQITLPVDAKIICDMQVSIGQGEYLPTMRHHHELMHAADAHMYEIKAHKPSKWAAYDYTAHPSPASTLLSEPML